MTDQEAADLAVEACQKAEAAFADTMDALEAAMKAWEAAKAARREVALILERRNIQK